MWELSWVKKNNSQETVPMSEKKLKQDNIPTVFQALLPVQTLLQKLHCASRSQSDSVIDNVGKEVNKKAVLISSR